MNLKQKEAKKRRNQNAEILKKQSNRGQPSDFYFPVLSIYLFKYILDNEIIISNTLCEGVN